MRPPVVFEARLFSVQRLFSAFPGGLPGSGLLILRTAFGTYLVGLGISLAWPYLTSTGAMTTTCGFGLVCVLGGSLVTLGLFTPLAELLIAAAHAMAFVFDTRLADTILKAATNSWPFILPIAILVSLALLGPGAYSIDAYLFGRRQINIPTSRSAR